VKFSQTLKDNVGAYFVKLKKKKKTKTKIKGETSQDPLELPAVLKYPIIFKNSQFNPLNFQLLLIWTHPYKLGHKIFQKD
jgi:hypothetical protein